MHFMIGHVAWRTAVSASNSQYLLFCLHHHAHKVMGASMMPSSADKEWSNGYTSYRYTVFVSAEHMQNIQILTYKCWHRMHTNHLIDVKIAHLKYVQTEFIHGCTGHRVVVCFPPFFFMRLHCPTGTLLLFSGTSMWPTVATIATVIGCTTTIFWNILHHADQAILVSVGQHDVWYKFVHWSNWPFPPSWSPELLLLDACGQDLSKDETFQRRLLLDDCLCVCWLEEQALAVCSERFAAACQCFLQRAGVLCRQQEQLSHTLPVHRNQVSTGFAHHLQPV